MQWDPKRTDDLFFVQSEHLHSQYHELRITIHRQFISTLHLAPTPFPSLTICTNAAHAVVQLSNAIHERMPERTGVIHTNVSMIG